MKNLAKIADFDGSGYLEVWTSIRDGGADGILTDTPVHTPITSTGIETPDLVPGPAYYRLKLGALRPSIEGRIVIPANGPARVMDVIAASILIPEDSPAQLISQVVQAYLAANPPSGGGGLTEEEADALYAPVSRAAKNPDEIAVGAITRSATGAATGFGVKWDDGATGVFVGTESTTAPGAIDSYTVTHVLGGVTTTYTQPALTRDANGAVTARPAMTVS
ncbi:hypothetical protein [Rhodococcoides fascians]|uniref:hypothetical protein n=1 Tax=Rhodococcoides fascians TaxID=1828 RepID=UPI0012D3494A|nr:hypothetical protein [Rhodococcus fascians]